MADCIVRTRRQLTVGIWWTHGRGPGTLERTTPNKWRWTLELRANNRREPIPYIIES